MQPIGFLLRAIKLKWKLAPKAQMCYVSPQNQVGVFCKLAAVHCIKSKKSRDLEWYSRVKESGTRNFIHGGAKMGVLWLSRNPSYCMLEVSGILRQQAEKFEYLGLVCTTDGRQNKELNVQIGKANTVLCEPYRSVVTKRELWNTTKLSVFKSVFVPILTYQCCFSCFWKGVVVEL